MHTGTLFFFFVAGVEGRTLLHAHVAHGLATQTECVLASALAEWRSWQIVTRLHYAPDDESSKKRKKSLSCKGLLEEINKIIFTAEKAKPWVRTEEALRFSHNVQGVVVSFEFFFFL